MIPISRPSLGSLEREYLLDAFDSGWISSLGSYVEKAEHLLRLATGTQHAAVVSNGTTALHLALLALDVGPGDEVIIPATTYVATLNAVLYVGATPVIVDVDPGDWCICPTATAEAVTKKTKAIIAVDLYGHPADYTALHGVCRDRGIAVIADAAESIGALRGGVPVGSLADVSIFSFFGNKVVTSGEGGALTTSNSEIDRRVRQLRNQGNHSSIRYFHEVLGYNYRMTNLSAAILTAQLERIAELVQRRSDVIDRYRLLLDGDTFVTPQGVADQVQPSPWMFSVTLNSSTASQRDEIIRIMQHAGVETRPVFQSLTQMPYLTLRRTPELPVAHRLASTGISLPTHPDLSEVEVDEVVAALRSAVSDVRLGL